MRRPARTVHTSPAHGGLHTGETTVLDDGGLRTRADVCVLANQLSPNRTPRQPGRGRLGHGRLLYRGATYFCSRNVYNVSSDIARGGAGRDAPASDTARGGGASRGNSIAETTGNGHPIHHISSAPLQIDDPTAPGAVIRAGQRDHRAWAARKSSDRRGFFQIRAELRLAPATTPPRGPGKQPLLRHFPQPYTVFESLPVAFRRSLR